MKYLSKYQFPLISMGIIAIIIGFLFLKPLTGEYTFGGPDSLSPNAIHQGITSAEEEYEKYPLWLPWIFSGLPTVHSFQNISDYYFPNFIINILKTMGIPSFWNYIFHFILAGIGVIAILRELGVSRFSSLFGGLSFALMPYLVTMVVHGHGSQMMTTAWLPWIIWSLLLLYKKTNLMNLSFLGILVGLQLQRAHVQIAYYTWMAAGLLILMLLLNIYGSHPNKSKWMIFTAMGLILGLCMAMWIYLPALNYAPHSIRGAGGGGGTGFEYATNWSFSFGEISTFLIPSFYGFGGAMYWGNMPFTDYPNYMGIIVLTLAVIGILFHESKIKWYFITTGLLALFISFGKHLFLYEMFYDYFPYFNKFRVPAMFLILTQFSVAVLAGLGLETALHLTKINKTNTSLKKLASVLISIIILFIIIKLFFIPKSGYFGEYPQFISVSERITFDNLRLEMINTDMMKSVLFLLIISGAFYITRLGWLGYRTMAGIIITASIIDMGIVDKQIIEPDKKSYRQSTMIKRSLISSYLNEDDIIRFLRQDTSKFRILPVGTLSNENRWSAFQIESVGGYHPAKIFRYNKVKEEVGWHLLGVLQMLNVKYVITLNELPHPAFDWVFSGRLFHQGKFQMTNIYQFKYALPRVFFAQNIEIVSELNDQLDILRKEAFNPQKTAILEQKIGEIEYHPDSDIEITFWSPDKIEIQADVPTDQFLVLSEIYYPEGWKISSHPDWVIYPVNTILRGILIPSGKHHIVMEFIPDDILHGTLLTGCSAGILILFILLGLINRCKENESHKKVI